MYIIYKNKLFSNFISYLCYFLKLTKSPILYQNPNNTRIQTSFSLNTPATITSPLLSTFALLCCYQPPTSPHLCNQPSLFLTFSKPQIYLDATKHCKPVATNGARHYVTVNGARHRDHEWSSTSWSWTRPQRCSAFRRLSMSSKSNPCLNPFCYLLCWCFKVSTLIFLTQFLDGSAVCF